MFIFLLFNTENSHPFRTDEEKQRKAKDNQETYHLSHIQIVGQAFLQGASWGELSDLLTYISGRKQTHLPEILHSLAQGHCPEHCLAHTWHSKTRWLNTWVTPVAPYKFFKSFSSPSQNAPPQKDPKKMACTYERYQIPCERITFSNPQLCWVEKHKHRERMLNHRKKLHSQVSTFPQRYARRCQDQFLRLFQRWRAPSTAHGEENLSSRSTLVLGTPRPPPNTETFKVDVTWPRAEQTEPKTHVPIFTRVTTEPQTEKTKSRT